MALLLRRSAPQQCAGKLPFSSAPVDDRGLADMHLALYNDVVVFDQVGGGVRVWTQVWTCS